MLSTADVAKYLNDFRHKRVLVVGDLMLDRFIWGNVSRISPEAPVPVVRVDRETCFPGGAANVVRNLVPFADHVSVFGVTGTCAEADQLVSLLGDSGVDTGGIIRDSRHQTIVKTRVVARNQQVVRIDREAPVSNSGEAIEKARAYFARELHKLDAVIIEDYNKGMVTQELVNLIAETNETAGGRAIITVDPNPNNPLNWKSTTAVKPNRHEAFAAAGILDPGLGDTPTEHPALRKVAETLLEKWDTDRLLITLGELGMALFDRSPHAFHIPTKAKEVFDVSGAGDTAIALFTLALASAAPGNHAAEIANHASGIAVGKLGTAMLTPDELVTSFA